MSLTPKEVADRLLDGQVVALPLSASELEDVVWNVSRKLDGEAGLQLLISQKFLPVLYNALTAEPGTAFHTMALQQLKRCASREDGYNFLLANLGLFDLLLQAFFDETYIGGYELVSKMFVEMAKHFPERTMQLFVSGELAPKIPGVLNSYLTSPSETLRIRLLDLFASFSTVSEAWFTTMESKGHVTRILAELDDSDLLARLSAFQLLGKVCSSDQGLEVIKQSNVPDKLLAMLDLEASGLHNIVLSNVITLIGEIASFNEKAFRIMIEDNPDLISAMHAHMEHDSDEVVQAIIYALARICCTEPGISYLLQDKYSTVIRDWLEFGHSSNAEMKATTFYSLSLVLDRLAPIPTAHEKVHLLYSKMGFTDYPTLEVVHKNLSGALNELKYAALTLFRSTFRYSWGLEEFIRFPGLSDWMVNRGSENTKKGHELKYEALVQAIEHPNAKELLGIGNYHVFREFAKLGVYYQPAEAAVAIKDDVG